MKYNERPLDEWDRLLSSSYHLPQAVSASSMRILVFESEGTQKSGAIDWKVKVH